MTRRPPATHSLFSHTLEDLPVTTFARPVHETVTTRIETVTAADARAWLKANARNRPISPAIVARYRSDMQAGLWTFAADPIRFDTAGRLLDGQHRAKALADCDPPVTLPFLVVRGLPTEAQLVMDQGRKRDAGQQLSMLGVKNAFNIASGAKVLLLWESGLLFRDNKLAVQISVPVIEQWVSGNPGLVDFVNTHRTAILSSDAAPSVAIAFAMKTAGVAPRRTALFFQHLHGLTGLAEGSAILALHKRFARVRRESLKMPTRDQLAIFAQAWNAWTGTKPVTKFQRPRGGMWTAENFPEPK
ncbi:hypothetical protein [Nocardia sp. NPDC051570]|uniref:hypothetical protein n=1 Tax=Nocardia sp. NPDC051570 TaxID=3364324 RepID=UPI00378762B8